MAALLLDDGTLLRQPQAIAAKLFSLGVRLQQYELNSSQGGANPKSKIQNPKLSDLLEQDMLTDREKHQILEVNDTLFESMGQQEGYIWRDLLTVHAGSRNLYLLTTTYSQYHTHTAPEGIYVLAGEIIFGFVYPNGSQVQLLLSSSDFLHIPAGVEHRLSPSASIALKAVSYFSTAEGWMPNYTGTPLHSSAERYP